MRDDLDAERLAQQRLGDRADARPGRRSPGRWPAPGSAGRRCGRTSACRPGRRGPGRGRVSGALRACPASTLRVDRVGRHHRLPLGPLGVADPDRDRAAEGQAVPDAAEDLDLVLLERHPGAPAVAEPAAGQLARRSRRWSPRRRPARPPGSRRAPGRATHLRSTSATQRHSLSRPGHRRGALPAASRPADAAARSRGRRLRCPGRACAACAAPRRPAPPCRPRRAPGRRAARAGCAASVRRAQRSAPRRSPDGGLGEGDLPGHPGLAGRLGGELRVAAQQPLQRRRRWCPSAARSRTACASAPARTASAG